MSQAQQSTEFAKHIGYKKCQDNRIVKLEILGSNNEGRLNIVNAKFAKMRCSEAMVLDIYDMFDTGIKYDEARGLRDKSFSYKVGEIVKPDRWDDDINDICSNGIHYFLSNVPAFYWDYTPENGDCKEWCSNGELCVKCTYKDGKYDGSYQKWHSNGKIHIKCTYKENKYDGHYEKWDENGLPSKKCTYKEGHFDGLFQLWYSNGQLCTECTYENNKKNGLHREWSSSGQLRRQCVYKDDEIDPSHEELMYMNDNLFRILA